jgi:putative spermidine/putrescine transport system substrate-binding protein
MMFRRTFQDDLVDIAATELKKGRLSRRDFLAVCALTGASPLIVDSLLGVGKAHAAVDEIVVANFGGDAIKIYGEAWGEPFTEETGIKVVFDGATPLPGKIKAQVDAKNVVWDVSDGDGFFAPQLGGAYLEPIDYRVVDRKQVRDGWAWEHGIANYSYSLVLAYDKSKVGDDPPKNWVDFFDTKKYPGKRAVWKYMMGGAEAAIMGDGVPMDQVYPLDMGRAIAKVNSLDDDLILWDSGASSQQMFLDGEIVMGCIWNTRASVLQRDTGGRVTWTWNEANYCPGAWVVPKGVRDIETSMRFIASTTAPERQIHLLRMLGNGPSNPQASANLPDDLKPLDPGYEPNNRVQLVRDEIWYAENYDDAVGSWIDGLSG